MQNVRVGEVYRHYRGTIYKIIGIGKHSETLEDLVIYEALYDNPVSKIWCRPLSNFTEEILIQNKKIKRFEIVK